MQSLHRLFILLDAVHSNVGCIAQLNFISVYPVNVQLSVTPELGLMLSELNGYMCDTFWFNDNKNDLTSVITVRVKTQNYNGHFICCHLCEYVYAPIT